ncbi:MAG: SET domain-containing protein-lysine N-methyltransferase [Burkholderiales bacterium]|nr:SET domain-containing protein-lysine N-methyltransferase [Burkholderiales bacterium]
MPKTLVKVRNSKIHGRGVFAACDIPKGTRIIEYRGKRLSHAEADVIYGGSVESGHTFLFTLNDQYVIDANQRGNAARWINHGCAPNCESVCEEDDSGRPERERVFIDAIRDIKAGDELLYSYFITLEQKHTKRLQRLWQCLCGARRCTGTMLEIN